MAKLEVLVERDVHGTDIKTGKPFKFDRLYTVVNKMKIVLQAKGTARDLIEESFKSMQKMFIEGVKKEVVELQDGTTIEYDQLFLLIHGEEIPIKAQDSLGKRLIIKALKSE